MAHASFFTHTAQLAQAYLWVVEIHRHECVDGGEEPVAVSDAAEVFCGVGLLLRCCSAADDDDLAQVQQRNAGWLDAVMRRLS